MKVMLKTLRNSGFDLLRYLRHSGAVRNSDDPDVLRAHIMMDTHRIEKGMALPDPRPGFGQDVLQRLITNTRAFETQLGSEFATIWARSVLEHYRNFNRAHGIRSDVVDGFLDNSKLCSALGGITQLNTKRSDEFAEAFRALALSRHSVRQFSDTSVDAKLIHDATLIAAKSPSVCNRQSARLHHITDPDLKQKALEIQGGNRGFGAQIPELLIVTSDLSSFLSSAERYQCWIDGGLFAMSLVYALHSKGLGTCMLNWSVDASRDIALRKHVDIPASENVIVFIAVGHLPKNLTVARSPRRHVEQILTVH